MSEQLYLLECYGRYCSAKAREFKGKRSENRFKDGAYWLEQREATAEKYRNLKKKLAL